MRHDFRQLRLRSLARAMFLCCLASIVTTLGSPNPLRADEGQRQAVVDKAIAKVRTLPMVESRGVGYSGATSDFYRVSLELQARISTLDLRKMLADDNAVVQSMALCLLARDPDGADDIVGLVDDTKAVEALIGCVHENLTVGDLALQLLHDPGYLDFEERSPSLDREMLALVTIRVLAIDGSTIPDKARDVVRQQAEIYGFLPAGVAKNVDGGKRMQFIKGVARAGPSRPIRRFLIETIKDEKLEAQSRLAAASGLTRDTHPAAIDALRRNATAINALVEGRPGDRFVREAMDRAVLEIALDEQGNESSILFGESTLNDSQELAGIRHPMLLERASLFGLWDMDEGEVVQRLIPVLDRLDECSASWNTYSDARTHAERLARTLWPRVDPEFGDASRDAEARLIADLLRSNAPAAATTRPAE